MAAIKKRRRRLAIHENIRARRIELGLTQEALGERCGCSRQRICQYESGKRKPSLALLADIATGLETDVGRLFGAGV